MKAEPDREERQMLVRLGRNLMRLCAERGKSLERVAYESGVSKGYIYDIAKGRGNPSVLILHRIASALEATVSRFMKSL